MKKNISLKLKKYIIIKLIFKEFYQNVFFLLFIIIIPIDNYKDYSY